RLAPAWVSASREDAYRLVQRNAMKTWETGADFLAELKSDPDVTERLTANELESMFDDGYHLKHVDTIFARVFAD
ncbi:MAG: adenylosuccinate lyase, partial [Pseudomonadota bacterium]